MILWRKWSPGGDKDGMKDLLPKPQLGNTRQKLLHLTYLSWEEATCQIYADLYFLSAK